MTRRLLYAWELGGGRGHVVHLATVAAALRRRGWTGSAALGGIDHAHELAPYCDVIRRGPKLPFHSDRGGSTHYGDYLGCYHFDDEQIIAAAIDSWRRLIESNGPDAVVADHAPCAVLAARSLGVPAVRIGVPATMPPSHIDSFPPFLSDDRQPAFDEKTILDAVNSAMGRYKLEPASALPAVLRADDEVLATVGLLDRYREQRIRDSVPPVTGAWVEPGERRREEVFVYLATSDRQDPVILTAIASLGLQARVVIAGNPELGVAIAGSRNAIVERQPLLPGEIARRACVLVHSGNHGLSCLGLRAGLPQVTLSATSEHVFDGRQIAAAGVGINLERDQWTVPNIHAAIEAAWSDKHLSSQAEDLAVRLAPEFVGDPGELTADRIEAVIR